MGAFKMGLTDSLLSLLQNSKAEFCSPPMEHRIKNSPLFSDCWTEDWSQCAWHVKNKVTYSTITGTAFARPETECNCDSPLPPPALISITLRVPCSPPTLVPCGSCQAQCCLWNGPFHSFLHSANSYSLWSFSEKMSLTSCSESEFSLFCPHHIRFGTHHKHLKLFCYHQITVLEYRPYITCYFHDNTADDTQ